MYSLFYFVVVVFAQMISARVMVPSCVSNNDCTKGHSCHKGICTKCLKCNLLKRKGSDCVVDFNECGECLIGYESILITDSTNAIKPCKPVRLKEKSNEEKCINDNTCPQGYYCYEGSCVNCFNCRLVNRLTVGNCPKLLSDCSYCMNGFEEVAVTFNTDLKLCERKTVTVVPEIQNTVSFEKFSSACMLVLIIIILSVTIFSKKSKVKILKKSQCPRLPSAPPFYGMDVPQYVKKLEEKESAVRLTIDQKQQAKVYKQPHASYYYREDEIQDCDPDLENNDESHMPNLWAPTASSEPNAEMVQSSEAFVNNHIEQIDNISMTDATDSPQQPSEATQNPSAMIELDENQLRDNITTENIVDSNDLQQGKNPSN